MIYFNGYVEELDEVGGGYDSTGAPIASEVKAGEKISCMWRASVHDKRGEAKDNGVTRLAYTVHIAPRSILCKRMRLTSLDGVEVGVLSVQSVEQALLHNFTKIELA